MIERQQSLKNMLTWFLNPKSKGLELVDGAHAVEMVAKSICLSYADFLSALGNKEQTTRYSEINLPPLEDAEYKNNSYLTPVIELQSFCQKYLADYIREGLVHGSLATLDYSIGWSDFDTFMVIRSDTLQDASRLMELRGRLLQAYGYLTQIDPLQHHGFLVCSEGDLNCYQPSIMPLEVLRRSKNLFGACQTNINVCTEIDYSFQERFCRFPKFWKKTMMSGTLRHHFLNGEYLLDNFSNSENAMYQLKYMISFVSLVPSYFLTAIGVPCYKKNSFERVKGLVTSETWEIVESATTIRDEWASKEEHPFVGNRIPVWVQRILGGHYFERVYRLVDELSVLVEQSHHDR